MKNLIRVLLNWALFFLIGWIFGGITGVGIAAIIILLGQMLL